MNALGYQLISLQIIADAIEIFKLNVEVFPVNANGYDSLGEAYMISGDKDNAVKNDEKALELDPRMESAVEALKRLRRK